jgi:hypothetical protein
MPPTSPPVAGPAPVNFADFPIVETFSGDNRFGPCQTDQDGVFGWENDKERTVIEFQYELETTDGEADEKRLRTLDRQLANNVLPMLFPDQCDPDDGLRERARLLREMLVVGVSVVPPDLINPNRKYPVGEEKYPQLLHFASTFSSLSWLHYSLCLQSSAKPHYRAPTMTASS